MQLLKYVIPISCLSIITTPVLAQSQQKKWVDFGQTNSGEIIKLNENSVKFEIMLADDTLNNEDGFYSDNDKYPKVKVVVFEYNIGGRKRNAYTKSCDYGKLTTNPSWKTYTTFIDYWPQYFLISADSVASQNMLQRVCTLSLSSQ
ncbi:hypothetical protein B6N60_02957 [Richelia sinica FACHB-800]|uniref:Uncharacterized protein n=1 Tax=Richelia sinica FACHB-800 TaxID=1357546 RepID=A0A975Y5I2_9NOST|nr:hypothetical protein [Richelia sinica]MBD2666747.1 hypothetical protein [Richelia sinica FACHB-800]QXE24253.1 hypothetical protein B6N60_02957 [Richelia sinica FACHB-800]